MSLGEEDIQARARTDRNNNPMAFTVDVARLGLTENIDFEIGDPFKVGSSFETVQILHTARILKDPVDTTIKLLDNIGFLTHDKRPRWTYSDGPLAIPMDLWRVLDRRYKALIIAYSYKREGGTEMWDRIKEVMGEEDA